MGQDMNIADLMSWLSNVFPSLSQYIKIVMPLLVMIVSVIGIFSDILPKPGDVYPVPDIQDIDAELKGKGRIVYRLVRISRYITTKINRVVISKPYEMFYRFTKICAVLLRKIKGQEATPDAVEITKPKPYRMRFVRKKLPEKID